MQATDAVEPREENDERMRERIKYSPLQTRSKPWIVAHSLFSNSFIRKYGILSIILCLGLGYLFYQRVLYQEYIYHTLPLYQRSIVLKLDSETGEQPSDTWKPIGDPQLRWRIFSAYFDPRLEVVESIPVFGGAIPFGSVRIFTVLPLKIRSKAVNCNFRYGDRIVRQRADLVEAIHENFDMPFSATAVVCKLTGSKSQLEVQLPDHVGLSYDSEPSMQNATSFVPIHYPRGDRLLRKPPSRKLAVCVGPAHHNYSNAARIVEFIAYWQIMGAERFYFYNKSITPDVDRVMEYYVNAGLAEVFQWKLDGYEFEKELRYEGIFAALNECLYRSTMLGDFRYTALVDFDEFLFPLETTSEGSSPDETLVEFLQRHNRFDVHSFVFRAVFFYGFYEENYSQVPQGSPNTYLYTQVRILRSRDPLMHRNRSKYVANGRNVIEAGNHFVWRALRNSEEYRVRDSEGLLFHYRDNCVGYGCESYVEDTRARRHNVRLWAAVDYVCSRVFLDHGGQCPLGD